MKHFLIFSFILLISLSVNIRLYSQSTVGGLPEPAWTGMMQDQSANFFDVQKSFNDYWKVNHWKKGCGYKAFKRWEWFTEHRVDESGNRQQPMHLIHEYLKYSLTHKSMAGNWHELGPVDLPNNKTHGPNGMGRVNCIAFHPSDPSVIYAGAPSGGLWKSTDAGSTWTCLTDNIPTLGVSAIIIDYTNPDLIFIGTGDRDAGDAPGLGVMKSSNGGITWDYLNNGMGNVSVSRMIMHPSDHNILLAATGSGLFKTTDGGENWINVSGNTATYKDICFKPGDPSVVYAASSTFYRSVDGGNSFQYVISGLASSSKKLIAVSAANPEVVYVLSSNTYTYKAVYKSTDSGQTFTMQSATPNILGYAKDGSDTGGQAWYDQCFVADPQDETTIYSGGINIWVSHDSGTDWTFNVGGSMDDSTYIHVDQHYLGFSPFTHDLYTGNDGGIYYTSDSGHTWTNMSQGLAIAQEYKIGQSPVKRDLVINGNQDNGSTIYKDGNWYTVLGADGMECQFDPADTSVCYGSYYYGSIQRSLDGGDHFDWVGGKTYAPIHEEGAWVSPYGLHVSDPNTMFLGLKNLWRSRNIKNPDHHGITWVNITPSIANTDSANLRSIGQSPANSNLLYFSREDNKFFRSDDINSASPSWTNLTSLLPVAAYPYDIKCHPTSQNIVFIICSNKVYKSTDKGMTWTSLNGSLPDVAKNTLVCEPGGNGGIYAGTDLGVYFRNNFMSDWIPFNQGFPPAGKVTELEIYYDHVNTANSRIRASSYGRGLWESDLYSTGNNPPVASFTADNSIHTPGIAIQFSDLSTNNPDTWLWTVYPSGFSFTGGTDASSQNPQMIFSDFTTYTISLTVSNAYGSDTKIEENYISIVNDINVPKNETNIRIFPNPTDGKVNVDLNSTNAREVKLEISETNGRLLETAILMTDNGKCVKSFDLSKYPKGTYIFDFIMEGLKRFPVKVVVK